MSTEKEFYRKWYSREGDNGTSLVGCEESEATQVEITMSSPRYGFGTSLYTRTFALPAQARELDVYERMLRRAFDLGREDKAEEVAAALRRLINPR